MVSLSRMTTFTIAATILGLIMTLSGSGKLQRKPMAVAAAEKLGYTNIMTKIGALELLGGVAAVAGSYFTSFIPGLIPFLAVCGLSTLMAGAVVFHVKANDVKGAIPAIVLFALGMLALSGYGA